MWAMWSGVLPQQAPMAEIPAFRSRWAWAERTSGVPSYSNLSPFQTGIPAFALEITGMLPQVDRMAATAASVSARLLPQLAPIPTTPNSARRDLSLIHI